MSPSRSVPKVATTCRPLRRDAERNRQRILAAAGEVFAERGLDVTLDEIARHAQVGVGTVYRRFPNKERLIEALFEDRAEELRATAEQALAFEDAWEGLLWFLDTSLSQQAADRGLKEVMLGSAPGCDRFTEVRERIFVTLDRLTERARAQGALRGDVRASDFGLFAFMLGSVMDFTHRVQPDVWRRCFGVIMDGLLVHRAAPAPLPGAPLPVEKLDETMRTWKPLPRTR